MSKDNVINFPGASKGIEQSFPTPDEKLSEEYKQVMEGRKKLEELTINRRVSLNTLKVKVEDLLENDGLHVADTVTKEHVSALRDIRKALGAVLTSIESSDKLLDMLMNDVPQMTGMIGEIRDTSWLSSAHLQTLLGLLVKKEIISDEEMKEEWKVLVKENLQKGKAEVRSEEDSK